MPSQPKHVGCDGDIVELPIDDGAISGYGLRLYLVSRIANDRCDGHGRDSLGSDGEHDDKGLRVYLKGDMDSGEAVAKDQVGISAKPSDDMAAGERRDVEANLQGWPSCSR